jgi:hypothetical protein
MSLDTRLWVPSDLWINLMPPVPNRVLASLPVVVFMTNTGPSPVTLMASTPCDVHYWEVRDEAGRVIQAEEPEICTQVIVTRVVGSQETLRGDNTLPLNGKLFNDGERYTVHYKFWGQPAEDAFVARHAV